MPHRRPPAATRDRSDPLRATRSGPLSAARAATRFDKWLWAARFYKTRSLAAHAVATGQARLDGERVKPAHIVRDDALVTIRRGGIAVEVVITACSDRRGSAQDAALLYRETEASIAAREREAQARRGAHAMSTRFPGRPTKRNRRKLEDFLNEP